MQKNLYLKIKITCNNDKKILELKIFNRLKITDTINPPNINP